MGSLEGPRRCQDGGWGWVVVFGSFLNHFLFDGLIRSYGLLYEILRDRFSGTAATTALIQATFNAVAMATGPFSGLLVEHHVSCRVLVISGGIILCGSFIISAYTPNMYFLFFSYSFIGGFGGGLIYSPMVVVLSEYFEQKRGKAMGFAALGSAVGTATVPLLVGYLLQSYGFSATLVIMAGIVLNHCVSGFLYRPLAKKTITFERNYICSQTIFGSREVFNRQSRCYSSESDLSVSSDQSLTPSNQHTCQFSSLPRLNLSTNHEKQMYLRIPDEHFNTQSHKDKSRNIREQPSLRKEVQLKAASHNRFLKTTAETPVNVHQGKFLSGGKLELAKNVSFLLFCFNLFNIPTTLISTFIFLPGLGGEVGISSIKSTMLMSVIGAGSALGRIGFGFLFDLPPIKEHRRLFHSFLGVFLGLFTASLALCSNFVAMTIVAVGIGLSEGGVMAQRATALSQYVRPDQLPFAFGILTMFQGFGNLSGPLLQGYLKDVLDTYRICYYYGGGVTFLSSGFLVIDYLVIKRNPKPEILDSDDDFG